MLQAIFAVIFTLLSVASALAQAGARDETYDQILRSRGAFQRVVHMRGDSYMRGYPLGFFPDEATPAQRQHPQWRYRSPASTFNALAPAGIVAAYAGASGQPDPDWTARVAIELKDQIRKNIIRNGDVVVFEDAGLHYGSPREFLKNWFQLRKALSVRNVTVVFVTTPDRIHVTRYGGMSSVLYRFDYPFAGLTHNDATRIAAEQGKLVDLASLVESAEKEGRGAMIDMIHVNVTGQCLMVEELFRVLALVPAGPCPLPSEMTTR